MPDKSAAHLLLPRSQHHGLVVHQLHAQLLNSCLHG